MSSVTVDRCTDSKRKADDIDGGMVFPLLKPILTTLPAPRTKISCIHEQQKDGFLQNIVEVTAENELLLAAKGDQDGCETPKSEEHKIPKVLECPPAPRKPRPQPKRKTATLPGDFFFFPPDLDSEFLLYRMIPPRKKLHWSKKLSAVAVEQKGGHHM